MLDLIPTGLGWLRAPFHSSDWIEIGSASRRIEIDMDWIISDKYLPYSGFGRFTLKRIFKKDKYKWITTEKVLKGT